MSKISADYERFLLANYPDEYRRITVKDVKEDVVQAIKSRLDDEYAIWCQVPEWIKNEYRDNLPDEVLNGNKAVKDFVLEKENNGKEVDNSIDVSGLTDLGVSLLAAGYAASSIALLTKNRSERSRILEEAAGRPLTEKERKKWLETRLGDCKVVAKDWKTNQPEKYLLHIIKEMSRNKMRKERAEGQAQITKYEMKEISLEREFKQFAKMLEDEKFRRNLINYMRLRPQQAALGHLDSEVLDRVIGMFDKYGIKIQARANDGRNELRLDKDSLAYELREQYIRGRSVDCNKRAETYRSGAKEMSRSKSKKANKTKGYDVDMSDVAVMASANEMVKQR